MLCLYLKSNSEKVTPAAIASTLQKTARSIRANIKRVCLTLAEYAKDTYLTRLHHARRVSERLIQQCLTRLTLKSNVIRLALAHCVICNVSSLRLHIAVKRIKRNTF